MREDDDSQSESLLMLEQLHENNEELTDSQQVNQAINEQLDNDDSDQSDTVVTEQLNEMSIINIDKNTNKSSSNQRKIDYINILTTQQPINESLSSLIINTTNDSDNDNMDKNHLQN